MSTYIQPNQKHLIVYDDCPTLLREFLRHIVTIGGLSVKSANTYYVDIRLFLRFIKMQRDKIDEEDYDKISIEDLTNEELALITEDDVIDFLYFLANKENSITTRRNKLSAIKSFFKFACISYPNTFLKNPATNVEQPRIPQRQPIYLTLTEAKALLEAAKKTPEPERDFCITTLFLNCGMRLSELSAINVDSISEGTLRIIGKGNKERTVYLNQACIDAIEAWLSVRKGIANLIDPSAMFVSRMRRTRLTPRSIEKVIEKELKMAGLNGRGYSPHKLRHTAATLMYEGGADVLELKEILGHEHTATTEIYTHVNNKRLRDVTKNHPLNSGAENWSDSPEDGE